MPKFSVVLATRDRPALFSEALDSVLAQSHPDFEVIVINDGSSLENETAYQPIWQAAREQLGERFKSYTLLHRPKGHGQSYSLNYGVANASGEYVCFLDDDDKWTDPDHLARAATAIQKSAADGEQVDLFMANQSAWLNDRKIPGPVWLEALASDMVARGAQPDAAGCFRVTVDDLMSTSGFCHLNCLIVRRVLFEQTGGMDEGIRWECDRDIFLKLIDCSSLILHHPATISYHRVPDPAKALNMTTSLGMVEKRLLQTRVLDRAAIFSKHPQIRAHARKHKAYALKKIARELANKGDWVSARYYAAQGFGAAPGIKWGVYTAYCLIRSLGHAQ